MTVRGLTAALCVLVMLTGLVFLAKSCGGSASSDDTVAAVRTMITLSSPTPAPGGANPLNPNEDLPPFFQDSSPPPLKDIGQREKTPTPVKTLSQPSPKRTTTPSPSPSPPPTPSPSPTPPQAQRYDLRLLVLDNEGEPVPGAKVKVVWRQDGQPKNRLGATDEKGVFEFAGFPASKAETVEVEAAGFPAERESDVTITPETLTVRLQRLPAIRGVVLGPDGAPYLKPFNAAVLREAAEPSPELVDLSPRRPSVADTKSFASPDGSFEFNRLAPGDYTLLIWTDQQLGGASPKVEIRQNQAASPLRIRLSSGMSLSGTAQVKGADGTLSPGSGIHVRSVNLATELVQAAFPERSTDTDAQGRYTIDGLVAGLYEIEATAASPSIEKGLKSGVALRERSVTGVDFLLVPKPIRLIGLVSGEDAQPLPNATVLLIKSDPPSFQRQGTSDDKGVFEFTGLAEGDYKVGAISPLDSKRQKMLRVRLTGTGQAHVVIRFYPQKQIMGRVLRQRAPVAANVIQFIQRSDPNYALVSSTAEFPVNPRTGAYEARIEPGNYVVQVAGAPSQSILVKDDPQPAFNFDLDLP